MEATIAIQSQQIRELREAIERAGLVSYEPLDGKRMEVKLVKTVDEMRKGYPSRPR